MIDWTFCRHAAQQAPQGTGLLKTCTRTTSAARLADCICAEERWQHVDVGAQAAVTRDASLVTGDLAKLGLGIVSLVYDSVLLAQHYVIFPAAHSSGGPLTGLTSQTSFKLQTF
jgi:hypothetical protein